MIGLTQAAFAVVSGVLVWLITWRIGVLRQERERLHDERRRVYIRVLAPYFHVLGGQTPSGVLKEVLLRLQSEEYRTATYELALVGSDEVVRAMGQFMRQNFRAAEDGGDLSPADLVQAWGGVLLAIRRDLRGRRTQLRELDMLRPFIKDIDRVHSI